MSGQWQAPDRLLALVQLGHVDIDPGSLTGPGTSLIGLLGDRVPDVRAAAEHLGQLPGDGWRSVHESVSGHGGRSEVLAAPHPDQADSWVMVNLAERDGSWIVSVNPGPVRVYPGRAARREGLRLAWPEPVIERPAGGPFDLVINLENTSARVWRNQCDDHAHVAGWLLDPAGHWIRSARSSWIAYARIGLLPTLRPGQIASLPVTVATADATSLPAGRYGLEAFAVALNLRSEPGVLLLGP
jgi:hypothetical protein